MANTTFRLTASKADTPISGDNPSANPASTPGKSNSPNTGFLTQDGAVNKDVLGVVTSPIVSGAFIFAGFILLLALIIKIKKNKQAAFDAGLNKNRYTTRILGFATFLALVAGIGGTAVRFMGAKADTEIDSLTTSGTVQASYIEPGDGYRLYCGTDELTINSTAAPYGYFILMHNTDNTTLPSTTSGVANITSAEDWNGLGIGEWGYYVGTVADRTSTTSNPLPFNYGVVANEVEQTLTTTVPVTFCAKLSTNIEEAEFTTTISYELLPTEEGDIYPEIDFNSEYDDDYDGLSTREENRYGMNPLSADSDMDSLSDYDELKVHHTDPLVEDTDEDGLADYSEVVDKKICTGTAEESCTEYTTNPLVPDYDGTTYTYDSPEDEAIPYTVTGTGDIPLTYIDSTNPVDIDESFENLSGKAYTFQSAGEVEDAEITVPYTTEQASSDDDDTLGAAVAVSDGDISAEDINAFSLVLEDADENSDTITTTGTSVDKEVNNNNTITLHLGSNQEIVFVKEAENDDDEILGAGLISKVFNKVKEVVKTAVTKVKNFLTGGSGGGGGGTETWNVNNGFQIGRDSFNVTNPSGYYNQKQYYASDGLCQGIANLARLLYLNKINLNIEHNINTNVYCEEGTCGTFSLIGLTKDQILHNNELVDGDIDHMGYYITGPAGKAMYALMGFAKYYDQSQYKLIPLHKKLFSDTNSNRDSRVSSMNDVVDGVTVAYHKGPDYFIDTIKNKIDKNNKINGNDPIVFGVVGNRGGHAVNALSLKYVSSTNGGTKTYKIDVYDSNLGVVVGSLKNEAQTWTLKCSKVNCEVTLSKPSNVAAYFTSSGAPSYNYLEKDDYFLNY